jgi:hypothetical protein
MGGFNEVVAEAIIKGGRGSSKGRPNGGIPVSFGRVSTGRFGLFGVQCNFQQDINFTKERLDRAVANGECCSRFQTVSIHVLATRTSDHTPLQVTFCVQSLELYSYRIGFKFEEKWTLDDEW